MRRPTAAVTTAGVGLLALALAGTSPGSASAAGAATARRPLPAPATTSEAVGGAAVVRGPLVADADGTVTVVLQLAGTAVATRQAQVRAAGRSLSSGERADTSAAVGREQAALLPALRAAGATVRAQFADALDGIKVTTTRSRVGRLATLPGVVAVLPVGVYQRTNDKTDTLVGAPAAWGDVGATGRGVTIGVIDSGLDYYHADFGGSGNPADFSADNGLTVGTPAFPNAKVTGGTDLAGDAYNGISNNVPAPDPDPLPSCTTGDAFDHGTHVAGTAAGNGVLSDGTRYTGPYDNTTISGHSFKVAPGTAPEALLKAYRVFGCSGSTNLVVDAINAAVRDNVNVINMSLGSSYGSGTTADAVAVDNASLAGVTVVTSAGNSGPRPFLVGSPSTATRSISVAANDQTPTFPGATITTPTPVTAINANNATTLPVTGKIKVLRNADGTTSLGCNQSEYGDATGLIVVTKRGTCDRIARAKMGQIAGATAVIMVNNAAGYPPSEGTIDGVTIPFLGVQGAAAVGSQENALRAADGTTVTATATPLANPAYTAVASFSSGGGRIGDNALKPDITAPGVSTVSALVGSGTGALTLSGTSMASPATAGVAADVLSVRALTPALVKAALMSTATTTGVSGYDVRVAGAGLVQARKAVDTAAVLVAGDGSSGTSSISFGYSPKGSALSSTRQLSIQNLSDSTITYDLTSAFNGSARGSTVSVSPTSVTVAPQASEQVDVVLSLTAAAVAALPATEPAARSGALTSIAGTITATPRSSGAGIYTLSTPFFAVPRGLSAITEGATSPPTTTGTTATTSVVSTNNGIHAGRVDVFAWQLKDPRDGQLTEADVRDVGVEGSAAEGYLEFAVNTYGRVSAPGQVETDISLDTDGDGTPEAIIAGVDNGAATAGNADGLFDAVVYKPNGSGGYAATAAFAAEAPSNTSTVLLGVTTAALGITGPFRYSVATFSNETGALIDQTSTASYDLSAPVVSQGDQFPLAVGASRTEPLTVDTSRLAAQPTLGWLFTSFDDADGGAQADEVPLPAAITAPPAALPELPAPALLVVAGLGATAVVVRRRRRRVTAGA